MGFSRQPVLKPEIEAKLKEELKPLWDAGFTARRIASNLGFGKPDTDYKKLKIYHVWFYRSKFGFPRRRKARKGKPRYKNKKEETMSFQTFRNTLNKKVPKVPVPYCQRKRTYLILHFWSPFRKSEIYERLAGDFVVKNGMLKIDLYRKKKFYRPGEPTEPFYIPLKMPMMDEVVEWIERFEPDERPFNFSHWTAWKYVKEVFEGYYPHFFRFDYITKAVENAVDVKSIIVELINDTGLDLATITTYIMSNPKYRTSINERELAKLKVQGIIK